MLGLTVVAWVFNLFERGGWCLPAFLFLSVSCPLFSRSEGYPDFFYHYYHYHHHHHHYHYYYYSDLPLYPAQVPSGNSQLARETSNPLQQNHCPSWWCFQWWWWWRWWWWRWWRWRWWRWWRWCWWWRSSNTCGGPASEQLVEVELIPASFKFVFQFLSLFVKYVWTRSKSNWN